MEISLEKLAVWQDRLELSDLPARLYDWGTISPVVAWVALFTLFPFGFAAWISLHKYSLIQPAHPFIGLENFANVIADDRFSIATKNTLVFTGFSVVLITILGLAVAMLLNQRLRGFGVLRAIVLLPWAIPLVSAGIIWRLLLHANFGALNGLLLQLGVIDSYMTFLSQMPHAMASVVVSHVWREFPLAAILFLARLQAIPDDYYEAAEVDGAGLFDQFWHITLPLVTGTLLIIMVYETMIGIATFDLVYVLTGGGPGSGTTLVSWLAWIVTFNALNLGRGTALSFIMAATLAILILIYLRVLQPEETVA